LDISETYRSKAGGTNLLKLDKRLLHQIKSQRASLYLIIALGLVGGVMTVLYARTLASVISQVFLRGASLQKVAPFLLVLVIFIILRSLLQWIMETCANRVAIRVKSDLRHQLLDHIQRLGPYFNGGNNKYQYRSTGELVNTAVEGVESLDAYISHYIPQLALAALVPLTLLIFIFPLDPLSGLVLLLTAPLIPLFMFLIGSIANTLTKQQWKTLSRLSSHFMDVIQGLTTLKLFGRSRSQIEVISKISDRYRQTTLGVLRVAFLSALVLELVATLSTAVVAVQIGLRLLYGYIDFEAAFFILLLAPEYYLPLRMLGTRFHTGMTGVTAAKRIFEILDTPIPNKSLDLSNNNSLPQAPISISFQDVSCTYTEGESTLNKISFDIPAGKRVALVGPSGAGKSTVAHLLLRFLEVESGKIYLDSVDLKEISAEITRKLISWVPQNPYIFHTTIDENIRIARPGASDEEVITAARLAHAHEFIEDLPLGYQTVVGERGQRLSGGQVQRIALARAFLEDAPIIIFDEASAYLDPELSMQIEESTRNLVKGRTSLVIAHRLNTIQTCDLILVMDEGRLKESGTHSQLFKNEGLYQQLITARTKNIIKSHGDVYRGEIKVINSIDPQLTLSNLAGTDNNLISTSNVPVSIRYLGRLFMVLAPFKGWVALSILLGFLTIASGIGLMAFAAYIISAAALQPSIAALQIPIVGVRAFGLGRGVFRYLERYVSHDVAFRILRRMRVWFYQSLEPLAPARLIHYRSGDLLSRVIADINTLENFYLRVVSPPMVAALVVVLISAIMSFFHPSLAITSLLFLLISGTLLPFTVLLINRHGGKRLLHARANLYTAFADSIQGIADLQAFSAEANQAKNVAGVIRNLKNLEQRFAWVNGMQIAAGNLIAHLAAWTILVTAIPLVYDGTLPGVYLAVLYLAVLTSFEAIYPLPQSAQHLDVSLQAAHRLMEITDTPPAALDLIGSIPVNHNYLEEPVQSNINRGLLLLDKLSPPLIEFKQVNFSYAAGEPPALQEFNLSLLPGQVKAIVGPSGAGKTTLVNLLLRFWDCQQGEILINGVNIRNFDQYQIRHWFSMVPQNVHLFNTTIRENLLIANPQASQTDLVRATEFAQIQHVIQSLPQRFETWIGEGGVRLSGGERQRLAIARAFLKNAPILILDEFSANLDTITEQSILQIIRKLMRGRSILFISHRLYGLQDVDEIIVLKKGCLQEQGTHTELLRKQGLYWRMWEAERNILH
jgi:ATP-binding cassette, subfamily C, bacterial CydCD